MFRSHRFLIELKPAKIMLRHVLHVAFVGFSLFFTAQAAQHEVSACEPFPFVSLEHGQMTKSGAQRFAFACNRGYFLASPSRVRCYRGNWTSDREPKCLKMEGTCDEPPAVPNAVAHGRDRGTGHSVQYVCHPGFVLVGRDRLTCSLNGHWTGRTPTCMDEKEPLKKVAERLKNSFVDEIGSYTEDGPQGRLLHRSSLQQGLELVLLVDRSSSVDPVHLQDTKGFVNFLLRRFGVNNGNIQKQNAGTRVAVLTFGTEVKMVFNIDDENITSPLAASQAVDTIEPNGGGTNIEGALMQVILAVSHKLRPKAKRALFLMTDGEPNIANPEITPQDIANQLKNMNDFEIFTVGIGRGINRELLSQIASEPALSHVFILEQYPDLNEIMKIIEDDQPPAPPISPDQCGYVIEGEKHPWHAVVYVAWKAGPMRLCGGVLICSEWILTAASCLLEGQGRVNKEDVYVSLGERNILRDEKNQTNFYVVKMLLHAGFKPEHPLKNNLALLKVNMPVQRYRPICLPPTDQKIPMHQDLNINASISGWGLSSQPEVTPADGASIQFEMESTPVSLAEEHECPGKTKGLSLVCAGGGFQTCLGLMGSPLIAVDPLTGFHHVLGVVNGRKHCHQGHNQYVELTRHIRWINQETKGCQLKHWTS